MSINNSPRIVTEGLLFNYDMNNIKSYAGPPLTNILPNGINAGYPTVNSGWGTYNTNQYGSGTYFSIGTITDVSGNIITCNNHLLRTYDVVQPETTGGGVTAGTNYLVRKWNTNTFSLYAYDGSQEALDIFQTHVNLNTDNRIAVSSGITNMWWGYPHLPNSGIMKQIVPNGFNHNGRKHDCVRIHWYRPDGFTDGMAYGNEPTITAGQTYTISFYHRAATPNCVGYQASINRWTNGEYTSTNFTLGKKWQKCSYTFTTSQSGATYFYWFNANLPAQSAFDISEIMIYQGSGSSEYVPSNTTRSTTQTVLDLTGQNTITVSGSPTYNEKNILISNSNSDYLSLNDATKFRMGTTNFTLSCWIKQIDNGANVLLEARGTDLVGYLWVLNYPSAGQISVFINYGGSQYVYTSSVSTLTYNVYQNLVAVVDRSNSRILLYVNGVLWDTITGVHGNSISPSSGDIYRHGYDSGGSSQNYEIYSHMHYNRALSATEVQQNFNALRGGYGV
jgi:hypothetical protein